MLAGSLAGPAAGVERAVLQPRLEIGPGPAVPGQGRPLPRGGPGGGERRRPLTYSVGTMQRVAIVDPTETTRESLRTLLLGVDFVWLEAECARYEYFFDVIQTSMPDLAIVALDGDKHKALAMIGQLSVEHPKLPILTISHDHQALLQSLQKGAKYFLTHPVGLEDMLAALRRALGETVSIARE